MLRYLVNMILASLIFFPDRAFYQTPADYGVAWEDVETETSDEVKLHGWYLKAPVERKVILFFHGNAGNISHRLFKIEGWIRRGYSVLLADYRGYGKSEGKIQQGMDVMKDAAAFYDWLSEKKQIPPSDILLYGESIGTAPAVWMAAKHPVGGLILEAPFTSLLELAKLHYPFVPKTLLKDFEVLNTEGIANLQMPIFIIHGRRDDICPFAMAERVFGQIKGLKGIFPVEGAGHNDVPIVAGEDFYERPYRFFEDDSNR